MTKQSNQRYNVPIVSTDLRREETIHQLADALEYLDKIAIDVFAQITSRVNENKAKLQAINQRVDLAQAKIGKITGSTQATKVFSSAKYPCPENVQQYSSVYKAETELRNIKHSAFKLQAKHNSVDDSCLKEKLHFYNVSVNTRAKVESDHGEGLGGLPRNTESVSSLLLFNTTENPYKKYVMLDPLGVITKTRTALDEEKEGLAAAPKTLLDGDTLDRLAADSYSYNPDLGDVPEFALPDNLPDLMGVADITYSADLGPGIAPSVLVTGHMPELPSVIPESEGIPLGPAGGLPPPARATAPPPPGPPPPAAPPPPPPAAAPPPPPAAAPPPPPGPAPPGPPHPSTDAAPAAEESDEGGHSDLLAAIRKVGGSGKAGLKKAKERKNDEKRKKKEEKSSGGGGGGDLMGALAAKLSLRRKGISGSGKPSGGDDSASMGGGSAMDRISAMIPAPPKPSDDQDNWD